MWKWKRLSVIARCERGISVDSRRSLDAAEWSLQPAASRSLDVCLTARLARQQRRDAPGCVSEDVVTEIAVVFCLTSSPSIQSSILLFSVGPFLQYTEALMLPKWANVNLSTVFPDKSSLCLETEVRMTEKIILSLYICILYFVLSPYTSFRLPVQVCVQLRPHNKDAPSWHTVTL